MKTYALVLCAGLSSRFGVNTKLLHPIDGKPLVHHSLDTLLATSIDQIVIVVGADAEAITASFIKYENQDRLRIVNNSNFRTGMSSSIRAGITYIQKSSGKTDSTGFICLGDMPEVSVQTFELLIAAAKKNAGAYAWAPSYDAKRGQPILFNQTSYAELLQLKGDRGAKQLLQKHKDNVITVPVVDSGIHRDFDTLEDFREG